MEGTQKTLLLFKVKNWGMPPLPYSLWMGVAQNSALLNSKEKQTLKDKRLEVAANPMVMKELHSSRLIENLMELSTHSSQPRFLPAIDQLCRN